MYGDVKSSSITKWWKSLSQREQEVLLRDPYSLESRTIFREKVRIHDLPDSVIVLLHSASIWKHKADAIYDYFIKKQVGYIHITDEKYPKALQVINDPPFILFYSGNINLLSSTDMTIGIVGTRHSSYYAQAMTKRMVWEASLSKTITCVSGLASGIDEEVWKSAAKHNVNTIAVVPFWKQTVFSKRAENQLIISEYPSKPISGNVKWCYVARNRIIAGLSEFCIVAEAPVKSGALITAAFAESYNREVYYLVHNLANRRARGNVLHPPDIPYNPYITTLTDAILRHKERIAITIIKSYLKHIGSLLGRTMSGKGLKLPGLYKLFFTDFSEFLWHACNKDVKEFSSCVIELKRLNVIQEWRSVLLPNLLYVPDSWQNI